MPAQTSEIGAMESLWNRFRSRQRTNVHLTRAYRFVAELEPLTEPPVDPFRAVGFEFRIWRQALLDHDPETAIDAIERAAVLMDAGQNLVIARDRLIEAFRVRWACENAPLRHQTILSLARYYRLAPLSTASQSKYEYALTRLLAGPIGPDRRLAPTQALLDAVAAFETAWGAVQVTVEEEEVASITLALKAFADEATRHADVATFTSSALLRRFGAFKASMGHRLFDRRLSIAVVETNVAVLNVLNQLLTDAGGQPLRWTKSLAQAQAPIRTLPETLPQAPVMEAPRPVEVVPPPAPSSPAEEAEKARAASRLDLKTGEVDLSGLEFVRRFRRPRPEAPVEPKLEAEPKAEPKAEVEPASSPAPAEIPEPSSTPEPGPDVPPDDDQDETPPPPPGSAADSEEAAQKPSVRAYDLGKLAENEDIIERYLTWPRSPEVWQLDLDAFLGPGPSGATNAESQAADRRRALDLILTADDLIALRATQEGAPEAEHRAKVKSASNAMLLLRNALRRSADLGPRGPGESELLLYVSDHLLWERLRLEASLKRNPRRRRPTLPGRKNEEAEYALARLRSLRRRRRVLAVGLGVAAVLTVISGMVSRALPAAPVDKEVSVVEPIVLPNSAVFDDARGYRNTLYVSAGPTWSLLNRDERRTIVRSLGVFAAERGFDTVSLLGPRGESWASFKDDQVTLEDDPVTPAPGDR